MTWAGFRIGTKPFGSLGWAYNIAIKHKFDASFVEALKKAVFVNKLCMEGLDEVGDRGDAHLP